MKTRNVIRLHAHTRFNPSRGGHAPGSLRDELLSAFEAARITRKPWWDCLDGGKQRADRLTSLLWNCTDTIPGWLADQGWIERGSSFARFARKLKTDLS